MIQLLREHPGRHLDPCTLSAVPPFLRRVLRLPWRKPAVPVPHPGAGTALPSGDRYEHCEHCNLTCEEVHPVPCGFGCNDPVLGDRMLSEVRAELDAHRRARQHADIMHAGYARAVDRLRADAGLPTVDEMRREYFRFPRRAGETLTDLPVARPYVPQPAYGQAPQLEVEPELAKRVVA